MTILTPIGITLLGIFIATLDVDTLSNSQVALITIGMTCIAIGQFGDIFREFRRLKR